MQSYKDLIVWKKSVELVEEIYRPTQSFPAEERYGLTSQIRRASISIPSNIAEGYGRRNKKENAYFVNIAYGSATEVETKLIIAQKLSFINNEQQKKNESLLEEVLKLLYNYRKYLKSD
jgi:four helix bundle protein